MNITQDINNLIQQKKWYNLFIYLSNLSHKEITEKILEDLINQILPIASQIYPLTMTQTFIKILKNYKNKKEILIELQNKIESSLFKNKEHSDSIFLLKLEIANIRFENNENIEMEIYEFKNILKNKEQQKKYDKLALKYFEKIKNFNESYFYAKKLKMKDKIFNYALHAKNVYFLPIVENEPNYFKAVREGNFEFIKKNQQNLSDNFNFILEKTYIIKILELSRNKKEINLTNLSNILNLKKISLIFLLIKALGLKLIKGRINQEKDVLELSNVALQTVTKKDLIEMKEKFELWRSRVEEVIHAME